MTAARHSRRAPAPKPAPSPTEVAALLRRVVAAVEDGTLDASSSRARRLVRRLDQVPTHSTRSPPPTATPARTARTRDPEQRGRKRQNALNLRKKPQHDRRGTTDRVGSRVARPACDGRRPPASRARRERLRAELEQARGVPRGRRIGSSRPPRRSGGPLPSVTNGGSQSDSCARSCGTTRKREKRSSVRPP